MNRTLSEGGSIPALSVFVKIGAVYLSHLFIEFYAILCYNNAINRKEYPL